jgi:hypothetical protein
MLLSDSFEPDLSHIYDLFRQTFANEEDALAATVQLFAGGDDWDEEI